MYTQAGKKYAPFSVTNSNSICSQLHSDLVKKVKASWQSAFNFLLTWKTGIHFSSVQEQLKPLNVPLAVNYIDTKSLPWEKKSSRVLMKVYIRHSNIQFKHYENPESTPPRLLQLPALSRPSGCVCDKDIKSPSFSRNLRWGDTLSKDQGSGSRAIYNGGWVVLKCSADYHLCIFGLGLRGLRVLWAACQRWNRKEKCSWKRMRRLRAWDLWNSSMQMKCTLHPGLFFPSIFSMLKKK